MNATDGILRIVLCGIGGYGEWYLHRVWERGELHRCRIVAAVDPAAARAALFPEVKARNIPVFATLGECFAAGTECDLVVVSSPIHFHCGQTCEALARGAHVLCEKPLCATEAEAARMREAEVASGRSVSIGYQWSFSEGVGRLRADILGGRYGRPLALKTLVCWPRTGEYYGRNGWAGRIRDAAGRAVFDSPASNAMAHFLHNMFYVVGARPGSGGWPEAVEARLFRANAIENYDTAALVARTADGTRIGFFGSHAVGAARGPVFSFECAEGLVTYRDGLFTGRTSAGESVRYALPEQKPEEKLWQTVARIREGGPVACGIADAMAHVRCIALAQEAGIRSFPPDRVETGLWEGKGLLHVPGLEAALEEGYCALSVAPLEEFFQAAAAVG